MKNEKILSLFDEASEALYAGDNEEALRLMKLAKALHIANGGTYKTWPGLTSERAIHGDFPYGSL